jgi:hypothetical protein
MTFSPLKLKPESGANRIKNADDAYSFMMHMRLSYQNKPVCTENLNTGVVVMKSAQDGK